MTVDLAHWDALERAPRKPRARVGKAVKGLRERDVQRPIVKALRALGLFVVHVPNGAYLAGGFKAWAALKADGCVDGFPDLLLFNRTGAAGLLEIKAPGGALNEAQERLHPKLAARGVKIATVCDLDGALAAIKSWGWL